VGARWGARRHTDRAGEVAGLTGGDRADRGAVEIDVEAFVRRTPGAAEHDLPRHAGRLDHDAAVVRVPVGVDGSAWRHDDAATAAARRRRGRRRLLHHRAGHTVEFRETLADAEREVALQVLGDVRVVEHLLVREVVDVADVAFGDGHVLAGDEQLLPVALDRDPLLRLLADRADVVHLLVVGALRLDERGAPLALVAREAREIARTRVLLADRVDVLRHRDLGSDGRVRGALGDVARHRCLRRGRAVGAVVARSGDHAEREHHYCDRRKSDDPGPRFGVPFDPATERGHRRLRARSWRSPDPRRRS
jgi:hypothetical protein